MGLFIVESIVFIHGSVLLLSVRKSMVHAVANIIINSTCMCVSIIILLCILYVEKCVKLTTYMYTHCDLIDHIHSVIPIILTMV